MQTRDLRPDWLQTAAKITDWSNKSKIAPIANTRLGYFVSSNNSERDKLFAIFDSNRGFPQILDDCPFGARSFFEES
jgi:hypothetical protein